MSHLNHLSPENRAVAARFRKLQLKEIEKRERGHKVYIDHNKLFREAQQNSAISKDYSPYSLRPVDSTPYSLRPSYSSPYSSAPRSSLPYSMRGRGGKATRRKQSTRKRKSYRKKIYKKRSYISRTRKGKKSQNKTHKNKYKR